MDTEEGPIPIDARDGASEVACDAEVVSFCDDKEGGSTNVSAARDVKTPAKLRQKVLDRDGQQCRCCGGRRRLMVHHIRFLSEGGRTRADNLITVCATCHSLVHEGLLVLHGEREDEVCFQDREGNALHELGTDVDPMHLIPLARIPQMSAPPSEKTAPVKTVTLNTVPEVVDGSWWRRHSHLIRFRSGKGLEFRTGEASPEAAPEEVLQDIPAQTGDGVRKGDAFKGEAFQGMVGLEALLHRLRNAASGSRLRGRSFPHTLFVGLPGTGKTTLARGVAAAFGSRLHATSGPLVEDTHALLRLLASLKQDDILFIDEIHAVPRPVLEVLYEAMCSARAGAGGQLDLTLHAGALARSVRLDLPAFTLLAATTEEGDLPTALRSRFGRRESLGFYTNEDLAAIAAARAMEQGAPLVPEAAFLLAAHARGTPREILRLVECVLDETTLLPGTLDEGAVQDALERLGYDQEGLDPTEQRYVAVLRESAFPIPLRRLARLLGASARTLVEHVEPYLFSRDLVRMTAQGRQAVERSALTAVGV